jgi:hypothetical protein
MVGKTYAVLPSRLNSSSNLLIFNTYTHKIVVLVISLVAKTLFVVYVLRNILQIMLAHGIYIETKHSQHSIFLLTHYDEGHNLSHV